MKRVVVLIATILGIVLVAACVNLMGAYRSPPGGESAIPAGSAEAGARETAPPLPDWIEAMLPANPRRYRLAVGGQTMHVMEFGQGFPVLLLHGNPTWGFLYRKVIQALPPDRFRCIVPDLVGLGLSSKPRLFAEHTLENHVRWFGSLLDQLALEQLIFVGQDWGGPIGLRALADRPGLARGMVLLNTGARPPPPGYEATSFHRFTQYPILSDFVFRYFDLPQRALHRAQGDAESIRGEVAAAYRYPLRGMENNLAPLALARMVPTDPEPDHPVVQALVVTERFARSFEGPVAIVWGTRDPIFGESLGAMVELLPDAEVHETQAGHFLQEEEPLLIADAIRGVQERIVPASK